MTRALPAALTAVAAALLLAVPATAIPTCTKTGPTITTCVSGGHTSITTTPNPALTNPWPGWGFGWGTPVIGLGGRGVWIGF